MRIIVADDRPAVRSALRLLLDERSHHLVVGEVADGHRLAATIADAQAEILLFDWELPGLRPTKFLAVARRRWPGLGLVAMSSRPEAREAALAAGADAFLPKTDPPERVLAALASVCRALEGRRGRPPAGSAHSEPG